MARKKATVGSNELKGLDGNNTNNGDINQPRLTRCQRKNLTLKRPLEMMASNTPQDATATSNRKRCKLDAAGTSCQPPAENENAEFQEPKNGLPSASTFKGTGYINEYNTNKTVDKATATVKRKGKITPPTSKDSHPPRNTASTNTFKPQSPRWNDSAKREDYIFFYQADNDYGFLSQWFKFNMTDNSEKPPRIFSCAEQYMMYHKAQLFDDHKICSEMMKLESPSKMRSLGRQIKGFNPTTWAQKKHIIVYRATILKFTQTGAAGEQLLNSLLKTMGKLLVEASPTDKDWGIGYSEEKAMDNRAKWGTNALGRLLVEARQKLGAQIQSAKESS